MRSVAEAIPVPVVRRFSKYLAHLPREKGNGKMWVTSRELAKALGYTRATVRQDFTYLDFSGTPKRGYEIEGLEKTLTNVLGLNLAINTVIVGVGDLEGALALNLNQYFPTRTFRICGIFDPNLSLLGKRLGNMVVQSTDALADVIRKKRVDIGIVAVAPSAAQEIADELISAGVRGLLNLTAAHVTVSDSIPIVNVHMVAGLQELSGLIRM